MSSNLRQKIRKTTETISLFSNTKPAATKGGVHGGSVDLQKLTEEKRPATNSVHA